MRRTAISIVVLTTMVTGLGTVATSRGMAASLAEQDSRYGDRRSELTTITSEDGVSFPTSDRLTAQLFYPPVSNPRALRVTGRGQASEPANSARLVFKFSNNDSLESQPEGTLSYSKVAQETLSKDSLKPVVDALVAIGVPADAIQVKIIKPRSSALPFPFPSTGTAGGAEIAVTIEQPTRDRLDQVVTTASLAASKNKNFSISSVGVQYSSKDCQALERAAYQAAVQDALNRAKAIAEAMGARMSNVGSAAEPFYNAYLPACNRNAGESLPFGPEAMSPYDPNAPVEVEITKEMFFAFPVE